MENSMVKGFIQEQMVLRKKEFGKMAKESNGSIIIILNNKIDSIIINNF